MKIAGFSVKSVIVWDRVVHGMGDLKSTFAPRYDTCIFAVKGSYAFPNGRPADVIQSQRINGADLRHPNEKPLDLMRRLIEATTKPNDLILDRPAMRQTVHRGRNIPATLRNGTAALIRSGVRRGIGGKTLEHRT